MLPGWYPLAPPDDARDVPSLSLSLSPIDCMPWEFRGSASLPLPQWRPTSLMGMRGLLPALLGPPDIRAGAAYFGVIGFVLLQRN